MSETAAPEAKWRSDGVVVVRNAALDEVLNRPAGGRAPVFDFAGSGGRTWIGRVTLPAGLETGAHHHGHHELAIFVVRGRAEIRWGERLEFLADIGPGDSAYFAPFVPHQERNPDSQQPVEFLVVRSDIERIVVPLDLSIEDRPEAVY